MKKTNFLIVFFISFFFIKTSITLSAQIAGQTIKGSVFDIDSHEPLLGATIVLAESDSLLGTTSDKNGKFSIENIPFGRQALKVSYIGYETATIAEILVGSGKEVTLNVGLKQSITEINEVVIQSDVRKGQPLNSMSSVSARSFTVEETRRFAGGIDDPARLVSAYAGVSTGNIQDNSIIVRGNAPQGVAWRLEGVEIPTPHHFSGANVTGGGMVTLFSSQVMANSDFYISAFPAEYGSALAAVFDMRLRTGNSDKHEHTAQIGVLGIDIASEGPFSKKSNASYLFNYRYSTFGLLADMKVIDTKQLFKYQDLSFKLNFPTANAGVFSLWGIGGIDRATEGVEEDKDKWEVDFDRISFVWDTYLGTLGLGHKITVGNNTYLNSTIAFSGTRNKMISKYVNDDLTLQPDMDFITNSSTITLASVLNHKFNAKLMMRNGITVKRLNYDLDISGTQDYVPGTYRRLLKQNGSANSCEVFTQFKHNIAPKLTLNAGVHAEYFELSKDFSVEPRVGLRFAINPVHSINVGYGLHSRPEELKMYLMEINGEKPNKSLKLSKAHHFVLGYNWQISKNLRFSAEGYYQYLFDVLGEKGTSFSLINYKQDYMLHKALINNTVGRNYGLDLTLEKFLSNNYYFLITASLFDAKYKAGDNVWHNTRYNKGYVTNVLFGREHFFKNNKRSLDYNIRLNFTGGERYSPVMEAESIAQQKIVTDDTRAFSMQHDPVFYADFTVSYRVNHAKASSQISLQVKNAFGTPAVENFNYNFKTNKVQLDKNNPVLPVLSYKIEF